MGNELSLMATHFSMRRSQGMSTGIFWFAIVFGLIIIAGIVLVSTTYARREMERQQQHKEEVLNLLNAGEKNQTSSKDASSSFASSHCGSTTKSPQTSGRREKSGSEHSDGSLTFAKKSSLPYYDSSRGASSKVPGQGMRMMAPSSQNSAVASDHAAPGPQALGETRQNLSPGPAPELPPLCPALVLPTWESRFAIAVDVLASLDASEEGEFDVLGMMGAPLLRCSICKESTGATPRNLRRLDVALAHSGSAPRASISQVAPAPGQAHALEILAADRSHYGKLELQGEGAYAICRSGQTLLMIDGEDQGLDLQISAYDGQVVSTVVCNTESFGGAEHLEIRVMPGTDPVLIVGCVLAVVLLCADDGSKAGSEGGALGSSGRLSSKFRNSR
jgi:hypothetical protein